jgi:HSP20 family protein
MALVRFDPFRTLMRWPSIMDDEDWGMGNSASNNLDVYETKDEVVVKANVAGVPADKVEVTFEKGVLRIQAQREEEEEDKNRQHYSRSSWNYSYRILIPGMESGMIDLNAEPDASVDDGVITVTFKKAEASKPRKLDVKVKSKTN